MKLSAAIIAGTGAVASAKRAKRGLKNIPEDLSNVEIKAESKMGNSVLSKARRLNGDGEYTWIAGYSLKFHSCVSYQDYYSGQYGGQYNNANQANQNQYDNGYYANEQRNDYEGVYQQELVHFRLCPSNSCSRCRNGADYVVELEEFVDAIIEAKRTAMEFNCETVRENCYCDNAYSKESCVYQCYKNAGLEECAEEEAEYEFDLQEAVECTQMEIEDEEALRLYYTNNRKARQQANDYYSQFNQGYYVDGYYGENGQQAEQMGDIGELYVGPYCSKNRKQIYLGVFMEDTCSYAAPGGIYEATHYGDSLPYSKKSLVDNTCIPCLEPQEVDYENYYDQEIEATEVCQELYEVAAKCEEGLDGYYPDRDLSGCGFIKSIKSSGFSSMSVLGKVIAGIFGATTALFAAASVFLFKKNQRQNVSLNGDAVLT